MDEDKVMYKMIAKLARIAMAADCAQVAMLLGKEDIESGQAMVDKLADLLFGSCSLLTAVQHPEHTPTSDEVLGCMKKAVYDLLERLTKHAAEMGAMMAKNGEQVPVVARPSESSYEPVPEEVPVPEFKGMTDAEIARSMGIMLGN